MLKLVLVLISPFSGEVRCVGATPLTILSNVRVFVVFHLVAMDAVRSLSAVSDRKAMKPHGVG